MMGGLTVVDAQGAFSRAISRGVLSDDPGAENYAGLYMYMYTQDGEDFFKHDLTRRYLSVANDA